MAVEVKLVGMPFGVAPLEDGGKEILVRHEEADTLYLLPLNETAVARLLNELAMSNDDLQALIDKQTADTNGESA